MGGDARDLQADDQGAQLLLESLQIGGQVALAGLVQVAAAQAQADLLEGGPEVALEGLVVEGLRGLGHQLGQQLASLGKDAPHDLGISRELARAKARHARLRDDVGAVHVAFEQGPRQDGFELGVREAAAEPVGVAQAQAGGFRGSVPEGDAHDPALVAAGEDHGGVAAGGHEVFRRGSLGAEVVRDARQDAAGHVGVRPRGDQGYDAVDGDGTPQGKGRGEDGEETQALAEHLDAIPALLGTQG